MDIKPEQVEREKEDSRRRDLLKVVGKEADSSLSLLQIPVFNTSNYGTVSPVLISQSLHSAILYFGSFS